MPISVPFSTTQSNIPPLEQPLGQGQPQPRLASALDGRFDRHRQLPTAQGHDRALVAPAAAVHRDDALPRLLAQHARRMIVFRPAQHQLPGPDIGGIDEEKMNMRHG